MTGFQLKIQAFVLKTNKTFPFSLLYRSIYHLIPTIVKNTLIFDHTVIAAYTDEINKNDQVCGGSDLDFDIVIKNEASPAHILRTLSLLRFISRIIPIIGFFSIYKESEFSNTLRTRTNVRYLASRTFLRRGCFPLHNALNAQKGYEHWAFLFFSKLTFSYYLAFSTKKPNAVRHFYGCFVKFIKSLSSENLLASKSAFCDRLLSGRSSGNQPLQNICVNYLKAVRGEPLPVNGPLEQDLSGNYLIALDLLQKNLKTSYPLLPDNVRIDVKLTGISLPQRDRPELAAKIASDTAVFYRDHEHAIKSIVLSSVPCTHLGYFLYFVLKDGLDGAEYARSITDIARTTYLPRRSEILRSAGLDYINTFHKPTFLPTEYYYLKQHGEVLHGENVIHHLRQPSDRELVENVLRFSSRAPMQLRWLFIKKDSWGIVDYLFFMLPACELLLLHGIITSTPEETLAEYLKCGGKISKWLARTYHEHVDGIDVERSGIVKRSLKEWHSAAEDVLDVIGSGASEMLKDIKP